MVAATAGLDLRPRRWVADAVQAETAKPRAEALIEPAFVADVTRYYARHARRFLRDKHPAPHSLPARLKRLTVSYWPYPVIGLITPWNFPFAMPGLDLAPALLAGAAVILKPSEVTPMAVLELTRLD
jgi:acyl-CoA reductase-like NAD-dependent aldehyde dehydrogenase